MEQRDSERIFMIRLAILG